MMITPSSDKTGKAIIENIANELTRQIRNLISAPSDVYKRIYLPTLYCVADFFQTLVFDKQCNPYSLLKRQLKICIASLKLRQGWLLPLNGSAEIIAKEEPLWTFAVFSASLFFDFKNMSKNINLEKMIAPIALEWLKQNEKLFLMWSEVIMSNKPIRTSNPIFVILEKAFEFIESSFDEVVNVLFQASSTLDTQSENISISDHKINESENNDNLFINTAKNSLDALLRYAYEQFNTKSSDNHTAYLRVNEGLFIHKNSLQDFMVMKNQNTDVEEFLHEIKSYLKNENDHYFIKYRPKAFEDRRIIEGILIQEEYLSEVWKQQTIDTKFQLAIQL